MPRTTALLAPGNAPTTKPLHGRWITVRGDNAEFIEQPIAMWTPRIQVVGFCCENHTAC